MRVRSEQNWSTPSLLPQFIGPIVSPNSETILIVTADSGVQARRRGHNARLCGLSAVGPAYGVSTRVDAPPDEHGAVNALASRRRPRAAGCPSCIQLRMRRTNGSMELHRRWCGVLTAAKVRYPEPEQLHHTFASTLLSRNALLLTFKAGAGGAQPRCSCVCTAGGCPRRSAEGASGNPLQPPRN